MIFTKSATKIKTLLTSILRTCLGCLADSSLRATWVTNEELLKFLQIWTNYAFAVCLDIPNWKYLVLATYQPKMAFKLFISAEVKNFSVQHYPTYSVPHFNLHKKHTKNFKKWFRSKSWLLQDCMNAISPLLELIRSTELGQHNDQTFRQHRFFRSSK